jgi:hypothetical protein
MVFFALGLTLCLGATLANTVRWSIDTSAARFPPIVLDHKHFETGDSTSGDMVISWRPRDGKVPVNEYFEIEIKVLTTSNKPVINAQLDFDCRMPQHGHGMNVQPKIRELGEGRYAVDGVLLHMRGNWLMSIHVQGNDVTDNTTFELDLT